MALAQRPNSVWVTQGSGRSFGKHFDQCINSVAILAQVTFSALRDILVAACDDDCVLSRHVHEQRSMAIQLPEQVRRNSPQQLSNWLLRIAAEREGDLAIVIPLPLDTVYERYVGGQYWLKFSLTSSEYAQLDDCARSGGALSNNVKHFECSVAQVVQRLSKGKPEPEGIFPWCFCRYYFSGDGIARGWIEYIGDCLLGGCSQRCHGRVALLLEQDGFEDRFREAAPYGEIYTPWDSKGGALQACLETFGEAASGGARWVYDNWAEHGPTRDEAIQHLGGSSIGIPLIGRTLPDPVCALALARVSDTTRGRPGAQHESRSGGGDARCSAGAQSAPIPTAEDDSGVGVCSVTEDQGEGNGEQQQHAGQTPATGCDPIGPTTEKDADTGDSAGSRDVASVPIQTPGAAHPPRFLPDGVAPTTGKEVSRCPSRAGRKGQGTPYACIRGGTGRDGEELRGFIGTVFGVEPTVPTDVVGVRVGSVPTDSPTIYSNAPENVAAAIQERIVVHTHERRQGKNWKLCGSQHGNGTSCDFPG